jgi:catechol 2,3-dioxygenase
MTTLPLDTDSLLSELDDPASDTFEQMAAGTTMGHVHLRVAEIARTVAFYRDVVGLGVMAQLGAQAAFLSAGGYHHHIGGNTWESGGAPPAPPETATLTQATFLLPDPTAVDELAARLLASGHDPAVEGAVVRAHDPSGNPLAFTTAGG